MKSLIFLMLAAVATARLAPLLTQKNRIPGRYIVKLKAGESVEGAISVLGETKILYKYQTVFPGFAAVLSDRMVKQLRALDAVEYIEEDGVVFASEIASWGLDRVDQLTLPLDDVFEPIGDGAGVDVYVIDTGINAGHVDFGGRGFIGYDAINGDGDDCNGHGTHCSGTVGGTLYGVAKATNVYGVRVLNCLGSGSWAGVVSGCEWVADNADGPSVASMSLGGGASAVVDDAVQYMVDAGIPVAVAAGNDDDDACDYSPARAVSAISVGATDINDARASFSNYGTCVDIFAPGVDITSAWIRGDDVTRTISGTSMACPHVAGAAAVMLGNNATLSPSDVKSALQLKSIADAVVDVGFGSPNLLLYIGEGSGGGFIPVPDNSTAPTPSVCGGYFNETSGSFSSSNYPGDYENSENCEYLFKGGDNDLVTLSFSDFDVEFSSTCAYDVVTLYDGEDRFAPVVGRYCDDNSPGVVTSTGNSMYMTFTTDGSVTARGFTGAYSMGPGPETGGCGHTFTSKLGSMTSPNYPENYGNHEDCVFIIQGEGDETVTITFDDFELESHTGCAYDALEVWDGDENGPLLARVCGSKVPGPVKSQSNSVYIRFTSDSSVTRKGFSASYNILA